jgi:hypothetical protein
MAHYRAVAGKMVRMGFLIQAGSYFSPTEKGLALYAQRKRK